MLLLIDNYDSFTYNLSQLFQTLGQEPMVVRNDASNLLELASREDLELVCLSPGPGHPRQAGLCRAFLETLLNKGRKVPVLGVCLGHQVLAELAGLPVVLAGRVMHGRTSPVEHNGQGIFKGLPVPMKAGRYHSLLASEPGQNMIHRVEITARTPEKEIMGLSYQDQNWHGVQFHPESVLTPVGRDLLANFISLAHSPQEKVSQTAPTVAETPKPLSSIFEALGRSQDLDEDMAERIFDRLMDGELSPAQAGALLMSLRTKGETPIEVAAAAQAVLNRATVVKNLPEVALDVVGTGGDNRFSFNCSTATALTCAALGHKVLKHGNRSVSSRSGSADVLERLGFNIELTPEEFNRRIENEKFVFLYAPQFHPAFKNIMPVRRELGVRTLFNILGPLVNPARPSHRLIGVYQPELLDLMAGALVRLGSVTAAVVHGAGGYDELTPMGPAQVRLIKDQTITSLTLDPAEYGLEPCTTEDLTIADPVEGAIVLRNLLNGRGTKAMTDMLIFNVGLALLLLKGGTMAERMSEASSAVKAGVGAKVLPQAA
ncbi:MAG: anthranilate phosphoribosyltransferase [Deltaproteobacteria bacterium]|jgi:anthranilate synthase/phosphoribosyltransferase|nr:anthranilate phosphoribosyltransferase [Deltaproteobacteria bacterium]